MLLGIGLVCVPVVVAAVLVALQRPSPPSSEAAAVPVLGEAAKPEQTADPAPSAPPVGYSTFDDDGVVMRYPQEWRTVYIAMDAGAEDDGVLSEYEFHSPDADHRISFTVFSLEGVEPRAAREYHQAAETAFAGEPNTSDWRRLSLEDDPSAPSGWDVSRMEATYRDSGWRRPDRWMLWRYAVVAEEGKGYYLRFDVPGSEREDYAQIVEEVFGSFELTL
ncbi:hypothetical protein [Nocardiopsis alborubida]|uniref:Uncharacterized protein n=1 Tax=Nocardiopsis alborubida TaxID=146802 RepID=A0A7X6RRZ4_9ACTN|nr:hypothetical protein [Nocardiopsis alborubida]NKY99761.1 hypothetical protein [Nocardiopsis alborubida]